ncbi:MAG TPA: hypothetical protein VFY73_30130 [Ideonella sp.]|uniref:hypothetical protein n=1 Tax=Ideonella sp. TaxID=1929293 RepID=UPI002E3374B8|nr:hypothetical protein [Ideonella sp.]HEX5688299.1 hypothetical protein [Ideonella sp.]
MKTSKTLDSWAPHDQATTAAQAWHDTAHRRARRVFAGLYGLAVLCLIWCALPMPNPLSAAALLPAIVAAQIVGALALLGWLLAWPRGQAHEEDGPGTPLERWLVAVAHAGSIEPTFGKR